MPASKVGLVTGPPAVSPVMALLGNMDLDWTALADREARREGPEEELARVILKQAGKEAEVQRLLNAFADASPIPQVAERIQHLSGGQLPWQGGCGRCAGRWHPAWCRPWRTGAGRSTRWWMR